MRQQQIKKSAEPRNDDEETAETVEPKDERNQKLSDDVDDILDEIDSVLEVDAEEFINAYIQKGGE